MAHLTPQEIEKQIHYRDARFTKTYDAIWQSVGKCVFCDLREKYIVMEEGGVVMTINLHAYIDGHLLIAPRRHVRSSKDLTDKEWATIRKFTYIAKRLIRDVHDIKGMQLVQKDGADAQSTVTDHVHFQCIPFDAPDLCVWNYRQLKYTPLENAALYQKRSREITNLSHKFEEKYRHLSSLPVLTDLIILNEKRQVLFQERKDWAKIEPDYITVPGGGVEDYTVPLEHELAREVREEIGIELNPASFKLVASRIEAMRGRDRRIYPEGIKRVVWNTYMLEGFDSTTQLTPGDDAEALMWVPLADIQAHPRISPEMKQAIREHVGE
jgi:diadenosine tetraphosphate (Ap4A) HIT family hydrolase/8-oxo-dGTP pyrophosphatase MutT (NUDIX family)